MPSHEIPYVIVSQLLTPKSPPEEAWHKRMPGYIATTPDKLKVYVCLNLVDHRCVGVGLSRDEALQRMRDITNDFDQGREG